MAKKRKRRAARRSNRYYHRKKHGGAVLPCHIGNVYDLELMLRDEGLIPSFIEEPQRHELATALDLLIIRLITRHKATCADLVQ